LRKETDPFHQKIAGNKGIWLLWKNGVYSIYPTRQHNIGLEKKTALCLNLFTAKAGEVQFNLFQIFAVYLGETQSQTDAL